MYIILVFQNKQIKNVYFNTLNVINWSGHSIYIKTNYKKKYDMKIHLKEKI